MTCQRCGAQTTEVAHFCQVCGLDLRSGDLARKKSFAAKPDEAVASFALISTIMPRGTGKRPQTYRIALVIGLAVALIAAIFGALPIAILVAAFTIPVVYIVYLYDVNLWEDEPVQVTVAAFLVTGALTVAFTLIWSHFRNPQVRMPSLDGGSSGGPQVGTLLLVGVLVPIIGMLIIQLGPVFLASRPKFDDLMDGLTFGVISGVAYSTFETLVLHRGALFGGAAGHQDAATWVALIFLEGFIQPLLIGTAAGVAAAEFSGLGKGYDGFTLRYARGLAEAMLAVIAYQVGGYLFSFLPTSQGLMLTLVLGVIILGILILRVRNVLHAGLMEAALEQAARSHQGVGADGELDFCAACEMPLVPGASFCNACGTAVRIGPRRSGSPAPSAAEAGYESAMTPGAVVTTAEPASSAHSAPSAQNEPEPHPSSQPTPTKRRDPEQGGQA
ncbi:PrsW family intramembrane metalloprotease [Microlunatus elymi]|uniref:PrsW family intramembrane metalloprotease n=1 Tax=Microlunatus elymi TaxID=2596828 RepID=A0A516Q289_9ACTN|nr:PrsW family intramembrane metalloprotease [Microlunatus elymi]QDP97549.1 PrsW family intramembrane metalloprotease [Microlunatus elymi]